MGTKGGGADTSNSGISGTYLTQLPLLDPTQSLTLGALAGAVIPNIGRGIEPYRGQLVADLDMLERSALEDIGGLDSTYENLMRDNALATVLGGSSSLPAGLRVDPEIYSQYFDDAIYAPTMADFRENIAPAAFSRFGGADSGASFDALGDATRDVTLGLAGQRASTALRGLERGQDLEVQLRNLQLQGVGASIAEEAFPINMQLRGGATRRGVEQSKLNANYSRWLMAQPWANPWNSYIPQILGTPTRAYAGLPYQSYGGGNGVGGTLAGAGGVLDMASGLF